MDIEVRMYIVCSVLEVEKLEGWLAQVYMYSYIYLPIPTSGNNLTPLILEHEKRVSATRNFNVDNSKPLDDREKKI